MPDTETEDAVNGDDEAQEAELGHEPDDVPAEVEPAPEPEVEPTHEGAKGEPPEAE